MKNTTLLITAILVLLYSCQKEPNKSLLSIGDRAQGLNAHVYIPSSTDGFGYSIKPIVGVPYVLPKGVTMSNPISTNINSCSSSAYYECETYGTLPFYMSLVNSNNTATNVIFPAGMVIPSMDTVYQNAILIQADTILISPNTTICVNLDAYCVNDHRTFNENYNYGPPVLVNNPGMNKLIGIMGTKQTVSYDPTDIVQKAVWDIADSGSMTPTDIEAINALP